MWEFVNLYSKTCGCNRFQAILHFRDQLKDHPNVKERGFQPPELRELEAWVERETTLDNPALEAEIARTGNPELKRMLAWSRELNDRVADMAHIMALLPGVLDILERAQNKADMIVVSQTPLVVLEREWHENGMTPLVRLLAGQEHGTKTEHIQFATEGKGYKSDKVLMVGDAPGDYLAASENQALFYPIIPGKEMASWEQFSHAGLERFFNGTFAGSYQQELLDAFDAALPENPPWI